MPALVYLTHVEARRWIIRPTAIGFRPLKTSSVSEANERRKIHLYLIYPQDSRPVSESCSDVVPIQPTTAI